MVIPSREKIPLPIKMKEIAIKAAVRIDLQIILRRCFPSISSVSEINMGRVPRASTATKIGIKARRKDFIIPIIDKRKGKVYILK